MGRRMGRLEDRWVGVCVGWRMGRLEGGCLSHHFISITTL